MVLAPVAWGVACHDGDGPTAPAIPPAVQQLKESLAPYSSLALAKSAGYDLALTDCMSNGDEGAMGVHWANVTLIDGRADASHPEALIYEPGTDGQASLVGVEYIVPYAIVPKTSPAPELFGQKFTQNEVFAVWALHVWTHRANPSGLFASWNPRVHC
ncbi:MAG: hypothetical protein DMD35_07040 [Gemmatimonadetes bacterium]|nr:MAG: hypothetical protein DMD35_07040 [Gemmatimonadota bacterium]